MGIDLSPSPSVGIDGGLDFISFSQDFNEVQRIL